jgi:hypothetical protein
MATIKQLASLGMVVLWLSATAFWLRVALDFAIAQKGVHAWTLKLTWDRYEAEQQPNRQGRAIMLGDPRGDLSDVPPPFVPAEIAAPPQVTSQ